jgi:thiamine biosynthesis lipoprotein
MIKKSIEYSKLSDGAFDITVGPLVDLWKIGTKDARIPSPEEIKNTLPLVGYEKMEVDESQGTVMLEKPGMVIDLGGIAKGYAADEVVNIMKKHDIKSALINLGGSNVYTIGKKTDGSIWRIGLQHPRKNQGGGFLGIIGESNKAVSTSGDYERYFIVDNKRYHHILNPKTGYPADNGVISDSIITDNSMDADAMSTVVFVLGPEKGMEFIKSLSGAEGIIATSDYKLMVSPGMEGKIDNISEDFEYDATGR